MCMVVNHSRIKNHGGIGLMVVAIIGLSIAVVTFLTMFVANQKAKTPYRYQNLRIPVPTVPGQQALPPLTQPLRVEITIEPSPETVDFSAPETESTDSGLQIESEPSPTSQ